MKFHAILHLVEDILLYGAPSEFDTGANESHHKATKTAAKLTQRKEATFDYQTAVQMTKFLAIDYAMLVLDRFGPISIRTPVVKLATKSVVNWILKQIQKASVVLSQLL